MSSGERDSSAGKASDEEDFVQDRKNVLAGQIKSIVDDLSRVEATDRPSFPERYFREIFLPYFAGDEQRPYPTADAGMWVGRVAGSPFQEVDIVRDGTREILFTVPAMLDRGAVNLQATEQGLPIAHIVKSAQQLTHMSPNQGAAYLREKLTQKALIMKVPAQVLSNVSAWNKIFERYGRAAIVAVEDPQQPAHAAAAPTPASSLLGDMQLL